MIEREVEPFYAPERILVIAPHADDIEFGAGGTVARWVDAGSKVSFCLVTDSGAGSHDMVVTREQLAALRREEQIAAAAVLGVQAEDIYFLGYPDSMLVADLNVRRDITRVIRQTKPELVVTMDPTTVLVPAFNYINHPDHRATGEAALYAVFPSSDLHLFFPELIEEGHLPHKVKKLYLTLTMNPNLYVDITKTFERKLDSLRCHGSQFEDDSFTEWVVKSNGEAGMRAGVKYAEMFQVMNLD